MNLDKLLTYNFKTNIKKSIKFGCKHFIRKLYTNIVLLELNDSNNYLVSFLLFVEIMKPAIDLFYYIYDLYHILYDITSNI